MKRVQTIGLKSWIKIKWLILFLDRILTWKKMFPKRFILFSLAASCITEANEIHAYMLYFYGPESNIKNYKSLNIGLDQYLFNYYTFHN